MRLRCVASVGGSGSRSLHSVVCECEVKSVATFVSSHHSLLFSLSHSLGGLSKVYVRSLRRISLGVFLHISLIMFMLLIGKQCACRPIQMLLDPTMHLARINSNEYPKHMLLSVTKGRGEDMTTKLVRVAYETCVTGQPHRGEVVDVVGEQDLHPLGRHCHAIFSLVVF